MSETDISDKLANLSVCEDRSPLQGIPPDSPRLLPSFPKSKLAYDSPCPAKTRTPVRPTLKSSASEAESVDFSGDQLQEARTQFNKLVKDAKQLAQDGKVQEALQLNKEALEIHYHEKLARRIAKMEEYLKNYAGEGGEEEEEQEEEGGMVQLGGNSGFYLHKDLHSKLYSHQKEGVLWMWKLFKKKKGGILGDDMGLGKTIQVIAFLSGLYDMEKVKTVMITLPVSVMVNWEKEFNKWAPGIKVCSFHGTSKRERERTLDRIQRRGGVMLTTYGMVLTSFEQIAHRDGKEFVWDYVILDEGHKIKNPSKTTRAIHAVPAKHRLILSGTPIQNNLKELWTLFDYVHQGGLLGTLRTFKLEFENPIIRSREKDSTAGEKRLGLEMAESLKKIIDPYFLRRTKAEVKEREKKAGKEGSTKSIKMPVMTFKNDFVVWVYLSDTQLNIYRDFIQLDSIKELLSTSKSPLVALTVLKKICDHPRLLSLRACHQLGLASHEDLEDELELPSSLESAVTKIQDIEDRILVEEAGKMGFLVELVYHLKENNNRCLIFSQSRRMLDIMQKVLTNQGHKIMRLDGTVRGVQERDQLVQKFQKDKSYSIFLLTTQVGGVGLTLTAADRVIIYDPSWNPATDAQAVDRAFRIGQTKNVVIYRLITCGTVEEKIYRRQIFKDSITKQTTGGTKDPYRYFTRTELRELFQIEEHKFSNTQKQLEEMHGLDRRRDPELDDHIAFLHSLDIFGISDHDLMFSQEASSEELEEDSQPANSNLPNVHPTHQDYIKQRVQKAKEMLERESSAPGTMEQRMKSERTYASVYDLPENRALMSGNLGFTGVPVFQPSAADNNRLMLNRPGGGVPVFQPKPSDTNRAMLNRPGLPPARQPQVIVVQPPRPGTSQPIHTMHPSNAHSLIAPHMKYLIEAKLKANAQSEVTGGVKVEPRVTEVKASVAPRMDVKPNVKTEGGFKPGQPKTDIRGDIKPGHPKTDIRGDVKPGLPRADNSGLKSSGSYKEDNSRGSAVSISDTSKSSTSSRGVSVGDPIDLTLDEEGDIMFNKRADLKSATVGRTVDEDASDVFTLPKIERKNKTEKSPVTVPSPSTPVSHSKSSTNPSMSTEKNSAQPNHVVCSTPKVQQPMRTVEEELIISPDAYTPLMQTRQKRQRISSSPLVSGSGSEHKVSPPPVASLEKAFEASLLVSDTPETPGRSSRHSKQSQDEEIIASFLADEDLQNIEDSVIEEGEGVEEREEDEEASPLQPTSKGPSRRVLDSSDDEENSSEREESPEPIKDLKKNRRRSVIRRVAVVESSEDEMGEDEDKENLHPSFSNLSHASHQQHDDDDEGGDDDDDEQGDEDDGGDHDGGDKENEVEDIEVDEAGDGEEESGDDYDEVDGEEEEEEEGEEEEGVENNSVSVYVEDSDGEEDEEVEEEEIDMMLLKQLLKDGKFFYQQKRYKEALEKAKAAYEMVPNPQIQEQIKKIKSKIQQQEEDD